MKTFLIGILSVLAISASAEETCRTWRNDGPYSIAICAEDKAITENGTRLEGLFLRSAYGNHGVSKGTSKRIICKKMGFDSYVRGSRVIKKQKTSIIRGDQVIIRTAKVINSLECN